MKIKFNINECVKATLTDRGIQVMKERNPSMFVFHYNPKTKEINEQL